MREIRKKISAFCGREIAVAVSPQVAHQLLGPESAALEELSDELGRRIEVRARPGLHQEQFEIFALDEGPPVELALSWLGEPEKDEVADAEPEDASSPEGVAAAAAPAATEPAVPEGTADLAVPAEPAETEQPAAASTAAPSEPPEAAEERPAAGATAPAGEPQALDDAADSRILPGSPKSPASEES